MTKKILCLLLALLMMTSVLTACDKTPASDPSEQPAPSDAPANEPSDTTMSDNKGDDKKKDDDDDGYKTLAEETGYGYLASYQKLDMDFQWAYNLKLLPDGRLMMQGETYSEEEGYKTNYITMNQDGTDIQPVTMPTFNENEYMQSYCPTDDGMWVVTYEWVSTGNPASGGDMIVYETVPAATVAAVDAPMVAVEVPAVEEAPEVEIETSDDDWMNSTAGDDWTGDDSDDTADDDTVDDDIWIDIEDDEAEPEEPVIYESYEIYRLYKVDKAGNIVAQPDITEIAESQEYFYVQFLIPDNAGGIFMGCEQSIFHLDAEGTQTGVFTIDNWINQAFATPDGGIMVSYYGENGLELCPLNMETMEPEEPISFNDDSWYNYVTGGGSYDIYMDDENVLYGFDLETNEKTPLLNWMDSDVDRYSSNGYVIIDETKIVFLYQVDNGGVELGTLTRVPYSELPVRETITIGGYYLNYDVRRMMSNFNRTNETYRLSFIDYSQYGEENGISGATERINMDLMAGKGPDILMGSLLNNIDLFVNKGFLVNLYDYMGEGAQWQKEDLVDGYRRSAEINGGLYRLTSSFNISGFWTNADYLGDDGVFTIDEVIAACKALPEDGEIMSYSTRNEILEAVVMTSYNDLINMETGECYFDTPEFAKLLEFCTFFPEEIDWETYEYDYSNRWNRMRNKELIFESMSIYSLRDMNWTLAEMGGTDGLACVGFPSIDGTTFIVQTNDGLAINANSAYKDICWEFISHVLSDEYQEDYASWEISVRKDLLQKQAEEAMQKPYYYDENGNKVEYDQTWWDSETGEEKILDPLSQEQVDYFLNIINSVDGSYHYDEELYTIITDEAGAYFAGQKPADEIARNIQSRVWTYINEQR